MNIAILFGGNSPEHEVSIASTDYVYNSLKKYFNEIKIDIIYLTKKNSFLSPIESLEILSMFEKSKTIVKEYNLCFKPNNISSLSKQMKKYDKIISLIHGPYGEDGNLQGFLKILNKEIIGFKTHASVMGINKIFFKYMCIANKIPVANYLVLDKDRLSNIEKTYTEIEKKLGIPFFIKAPNQGSSFGVFKIHSKEEFIEKYKECLKFDNTILAEEMIIGDEIEVSFLELKHNKKFISLPGKLKPFDEFYTYEDKYINGKTQFEIPAKLPEDAISKIQKLAETIINKIDGQGFARIDFFYNKKTNTLICNEINSIPGFTSISMFPQLIINSGITEKEMFKHLFKI